MRQRAVLLIIGLLLWGPNVEAALSVSPPRVVLQGKPQHRLKGTFTITNTGMDVLDVRAEPEDWNQGIGGSRGPVKWLTVQPEKLTLKPGQHAKIHYAIRVPKAASGELRVQVFFTTEAKGTIPMRSRLGAIIYVGIQGTVHVDGALTKLEAQYTASTPGIHKPDELALTMRIRNLGNAHMIPEGEATLWDTAGQSVAKLTLDPGWGLLPHEEETYRAIGHGIHLKPGRYVLDVHIRCGLDVHTPMTIRKMYETVVTTDGQFLLE